MYIYRYISNIEAVFTIPLTCRAAASFFSVLFLLILPIMPLCAPKRSYTQHAATVTTTTTTTAIHTMCNQNVTRLYMFLFFFCHFVCKKIVDKIENESWS